jgi:hypothetical protein
MGDDAMREEREFNTSNIEEFRRNGGKVGGQGENKHMPLAEGTTWDMATSMGALLK